MTNKKTSIKKAVDNTLAECEQIESSRVTTTPDHETVKEPDHETVKEPEPCDLAKAVASENKGKPMTLVQLKRLAEKFEVSMQEVAELNKAVNK